MDLTSFIQRWGYTYGRASLVRFPLEQRWNDVLDFFGSDEKLIIIGGKKVFKNVYFYVRFADQRVVAVTLLLHSMTSRIKATE